MLKRSNKAQTKHTGAPVVKRATRTINKKKTTLRSTPKRNISIFQAFTGQSNTKQQPLDLVHPDVILPQRNQHVIGFGTPQISTLSNGIKVVTATSPVPMTNITLAVKAGSRYESPELGEAGLTHFMERAILRSTTNRVTGTLFRDMAKLGADLEASAGREMFLIKASTPTRINPVLGAVADVVKHAAYDLIDTSADVVEYLHDNEVRAREGADGLLDETLHLAAFGPHSTASDGSLSKFGLGNSLYMSNENLDALTPGKMQKFHKKFMTADRMTLGAVGVDHESFVALAEEMFGGIPIADAATIASIPQGKTGYVAHDLRLHDHEHTDDATISLAWNAPPLTSNSLAATNVLQTVLGGGASFSSGGPGKGMYSRLYRNVLQSYDFVKSVDSFYTNYTDAGLFGVTGVVPAGSANDFAEVILQEVGSLSESITDEEVNRAKNMLRSNLLGQMATGEEFSEELTTNVAVFGKYQFPTFLEQIEAVSTQNVKDLAEMISQQPITVVAHGDAADLPRDMAM